MGSVRIQSGDVEPIQVFARDKKGRPLTGLSDLFVRVRRDSDGFYLDFAGPTFTAGGSLSAALSEVSATLAPGLYELSGGLDTGAITNPAADDNLQIIPTQTPGTNAALPGPGEIKIDQWVGNIDKPISEVFYFGAVWIDTANGTAGTTVGTHGTADNPVDNLADAETLAAAIGLRSFVVVSGNLTLTGSLTEWSVELRNESTIDFGSNSVNGSTFTGGSLSGIMTGAIVATDSVLESVSGFRGTAQRCGIGGTITLGAGEATFDRCRSQEPGTGTPTIDMVGAGRTMNLRAYSGGMQIENMTDSGNRATAEFVAGQIIVDSSCTAGTLAIRGIVDPVTDNSAGTSVVTGAVCTPATINALLSSIHGAGDWGLTTAQALQLIELWKIHGLETGTPLVVDSAASGSRTAGAGITQTVTTVGTITTVTR